MKEFGQKWWGKQWLNALANIDYSNRLSRGKRYARNGSVISIGFEKNFINADVKGSRPKPYKVRISVPPFEAKEKEVLLNEVKNDALLLTKLLSRELPADLHAIAISHGIEIFPETWESLQMHCSCPDWAVPCKHLAAVIYMIAHEIDKDPFLAFRLHGLDLLTELEKETPESNMTGSFSLPHITNLLTNKRLNERCNFNEEKYKKLDFSIIEDSRENIIKLLEPSPLFFPKDFREILNKTYKTTAKAIAKQKTNDKKDKPLTQLPEIIILKEKNLFAKYPPANELANLLESIPLKEVSSHNVNFIAIHSLWNFSRHLVEKSSVIPRIILVDEGYKIQWVPALNIPAVKETFERLMDIFPASILEVQEEGNNSGPLYFKTKKEEFLAITGIFIQFYFEIFAFEKVQGKFAFSTLETNILNFFLKGEPQAFKEFEETSFPEIISLWLNNLFIAEKNYIPFLKIDEEKEGSFALETLIEIKKKEITAPLKLDKFLKTKKYGNIKFDVLRDLTLLAKYIPEIEKNISTGGKEKSIIPPENMEEILLQSLPVIKMLGINILLPEALKYLVRPKLSLRLKSGGAGEVSSYLSLKKILDFNWKVAMGDHLLEEDEFRKIVKKASGIVKIKGKYVLLKKDNVEKLLKTLENPPSLKGNELLQIALNDSFNGTPIEITPEVRKIMGNLLSVESIPPPPSLRAQFRPYQQKGYEWMVKNSRIGFGSLIADDMGLGKTLQVIATLLKFKVEGLLNGKKALAVVPTTLLTNWEQEIFKFAPGLRVMIYHGTTRKPDFEDADLILTTYGTARRDVEELNNFKWFCLIIDEAQNIKSPVTQQTKAIKSIRAEIKIAMSGTPVENRLAEYWSIMDFTNKGYLGPLSNFIKNFARPIETDRNREKLETFKKITSPFILRRLKTDKSIISDLPEKIENDRFCSLSKEQISLYQNVVDQTMETIEKSEGIQRKGLILKLMTTLKQICNHPQNYLKTGKIADPSFSGKTEMLFSLLETIIENNEKTLIFTQYTEMGGLLVKMIYERFGRKPSFLHGGKSRKERDKLVKEFQENREEKIFILSLKAGGTGLNLTAANNVIHYDLWWNPAVEAQATDRAFRIGQKKNVMVYRLITKSTFEEKINKMIKNKKELANLTVNAGEKWIGELNDIELKNLVSLNK